MFLEKGSSVLESIAAIALLGIVILMVSVSVLRIRTQRTRAVWSLEAIRCLSNETDYLRTHPDQLEPGIHEFHPEFRPSVPDCRAVYKAAVSKSGLSRVQLTVTWPGGQKTLEVFIHVP